MNHLTDHIQNHDLREDNCLHVIGVIQNAARWHSRYRLFRQWANEMLNTPHVKLHVVEAIHGQRHAECAPKNGEYSYYKVHTNSEIWLKENLINLGVKHLLPSDWAYVAWIDCDVHFRNANWAQESLHQLQHYQIIQPWSDAIDLSFDGGVMNHFKSCGYYSAKHIPQHPSGRPYKNTKYGHVGYAWCATRFWYENVNKLLDFAILGAGDNHIAWSCLGDVLGTINPKMTDGYKNAALDFQSRALYACEGIIGYTPGRLEHHFHGSKIRRGYWSRWGILIKHHYDPLMDLKYTREGVLHLKGKHGLEHDIRLYNRDRREDSIDHD